MRFRLLLNQLEAPRRLDRTRNRRQILQVTSLGQVLADQPRNENLRPLLPLVHDLLGRHDLIALEPIEQRNAHDRGLDSGIVSQRREDRALHLDVHDTEVVQLLEVVHLVLFGVLAEGSVQAALTYGKTVGDQSSEHRFDFDLIWF